MFVILLTCNRGRNSRRLPAKAGSNYHLAGSLDIEMSEKSRLKITYLYKISYLVSKCEYFLIKLPVFLSKTGPEGRSTAI